MATEDPYIGRVFRGTIKIIRELGQGGMGSVYEAHQEHIDRRLAVKILSPDRAGDANAAKYFLREAKAASRLRHPNIIEIIDFGKEPDDTLFLAMEYIPGRPLGEIIKEEFPLEPARVVSIVSQVLSALDEAHANGFVHRDIKPDNIMLEPLRDGKELIKVLDFGVAKNVDPEVDPTGPITKAGALVGTPEYMAPEQAVGDKVDARTDLYALGVVLYQLLTGESPFKGKSIAAVLVSVVQGDLPAAVDKRPDLHIDRSLSDICVKAMMREREDRYQSAAEFAAALARVNLGSSPRAREAQRTLDNIGGEEDDRTSKVDAEGYDFDSDPGEEATDIVPAGVLDAVGLGVGGVTSGRFEFGSRATTGPLDTEIDNAAAAPGFDQFGDTGRLQTGNIETSQLPTSQLETNKLPETDSIEFEDTALAPGDAIDQALGSGVPMFETNALDDMTTVPTPAVVGDSPPKRRKRTFLGMGPDSQVNEFPEPEPPGEPDSSSGPEAVALFATPNDAAFPQPAGDLRKTVPATTPRPKPGKPAAKKSAQKLRAISVPRPDASDAQFDAFELDLGDGPAKIDIEKPPPPVSSKQKVHREHRPTGNNRPSSLANPIETAEMPDANLAYPRVSTLSDSAREAMEATKPKFPTTYALSFLGVLVLLGVFIFGTGGDDDEKPAEAADVGVAAVPDAGVVAPDEPPPPAVETKKMVVKTKPPALTVFKDGQKLGTSPHDLEVTDAEFPFFLSTKRSGKEWRVHVPEYADTVVIDVDALRKEQKKKKK